MSVHIAVALDRIVFWIDMYKGNVSKAKEGLRELGFEAIDELWDEGEKRWLVRKGVGDKKMKREKKLALVVNVIGKGMVKVR